MQIIKPLLYFVNTKKLNSGKENLTFFSLILYCVLSILPLRFSLPQEGFLSLPISPEEPPETGEVTAGFTVPLPEAVVSAVLPSAGVVSAGLVSAALPSAGLVSAGLVSSALPSAGVVSAGLVSAALPSAEVVSAGLVSAALPSAGVVSAALVSPALVSAALVSPALVSAAVVSAAVVSAGSVAGGSRLMRTYTPEAA